MIKIELPKGVPVEAEIIDAENFDGNWFARFTVLWEIFGRYEFRKTFLNSRSFVVRERPEESFLRGIVLRHWEELDKMLKGPVACFASDLNRLVEHLESLQKRPSYLPLWLWKIRLWWHARKQVMILLMELTGD